MYTLKHTIEEANIFLLLFYFIMIKILVQFLINILDFIIKFKYITEFNLIVFFFNHTICILLINVNLWEQRGFALLFYSIALQKKFINC